MNIQIALNHQQIVSHFIFFLMDNGEEREPSIPVLPQESEEDVVDYRLHPQKLKAMSKIQVFEKLVEHVILMLRITGNRVYLTIIKECLKFIVANFKHCHGNDAHVEKVKNRVLLLQDRFTRVIYQRQMQEKLLKEIEGLKKQKVVRIMQMRELQVACHRKKGNIRLMVRLRPKKQNKVGAKVEKEQLKVLKDVCSTDLRFTFNSSVKKEDLSEVQWQTHACDTIFDESAKQENIFIELEPYVTSSMLGDNAVLFCSGQTGTGKTFTVFGNPRLVKIGRDSGLLARCFSQIFRRIVEEQLPLRVSVGAFEVDSACRSMFEALCDGIIVQNLEQALLLVQYIHDNKRTEKTGKNDTSSRSHAIVVINFQGIVKGRKIDSNLVIADLAGNQNMKNTLSQASSKDTQQINRSLSALTRFMMSFKSKEESYFNPKESPLTLLMSRYFDKSALAVMILTLSPDYDDLAKTKASLAYASTFKL